MPTIEAETFTQEQTEKIHLLKTGLPEMNYFQCFCSFSRDFEPETQTVDLDDDEVCTTCANGWRRKYGEPTDVSTDADTAANPHPLTH